MFGPNLHINKDLKIIFLFFLTVLLIPLSVNSQTKEVIAQPGEGIYRLLSRNGLPPEKYLNIFIEINKDKLGPGDMLYAGKKYILPDQADESKAKSGKNIIKLDIFGKDYSEVEIINNKLNGAVYHLMSGHGGPDPGAVGKYGDWLLCEDEYAYDVTLRLARNLIQHGATVYMITFDPYNGIRDDNYLKPDKNEKCYPNLTIPLNQNKRLKQRTNAVNNLYNKHRGQFQRMVAIHLDSRSHGENIDVFYYHDERSEKGKKAAKILQSTFQKKYDTHQPGRGYKGTVSSRNLYVVRNTLPVAVYIELGNINHKRDQQRFILPNNRQALANWLTEGLITDFETNK
ncbi:MAG: N-acetylmuramoyl-L-alanine amidase [Bacteroidales bacterium]|nr:N-acetylmuramoyl-L-alanine amidase [Bacteroidales bacterium]